MSLNPNYRMTITVFNCLRAADNGGKEAWQKTVMPDCYFSSVRHVQATTDGFQVLDDTHIARVPKSDKYLPYREWKAAKNRAESFTLSKGDLVILGDIPEAIDGTKGHRVTDLLLKYAPDAFKIATVADNTRVPFGSHYRVEG